MQHRAGMFAAAIALSVLAGAAPLAVSCAQAPIRAGEAGAAVTPLFRTEDERATYKALYDAVLAEWPAPHESLYVPTRFGRTHVIASGPADAPPLVLLHAMMTSAAVWRPNIEALSRRYRVYAVDVIGEPNLSEPVRRLGSAADCADWLADLFDGLHIARASVVGNSLGGFLALNQAAMTPERVEKVVLISPVGIAPLKLEFFWRVGLSMAFGMDRQMSDWFGNGVAWDPANNRWGALNAAGQESGPGINASFGDFSDETLRSISRPVLLLIGDREVVFDVDKAMKRAKANIAGVETQLVPGANHLAALAKPDDVNARILTFLEKPSH